MPQYMDIAVNLIGSSLEKDIQRVVDDAKQHDVTSMVVIGSHLEESQHAMTLCQQFPEQLFSTAGVHPHHASEWNLDSVNAIRQLATAPCVVAIGECGLDYNRDFSPRDIQRQVFADQLALAVELNMPVLMHERDAHADFLAILKEYRPQLPAALLHCFTGNKASLEAYIEQDLYLGVTGWVCDERRGQELASIVPLIPNERILIETDSPYLIPRSMRPKPKSSKNEPKYLPYIAQYIADLKQQPLELFAGQTYFNSRTFFGLDN
ncbi:TatD family hydrolase [Shewanella marinintestina]|uniref:TatD family hydrolase n=1 Tax=Shewanella marinintestina TaxID=190305 RepID=UPI00200D62CA|nr:TatD family hydrolase [Shewanella marinintestina]MCL1146423.1 TatD family hydrolase [Shewanella marinintestina]